MKDKIKKILLLADKPARYLGGEFNTPLIKKDATLKYLLCFPDVYEVAMSNLGIRILYDVLNKREDTSCENCFAPWPDFGSLLRENELPLYSLETFTPMNEYNIIGFSLQYEMCYTNILYMLSLGKVKMFSKDRGENDPIIMAGGPCTVNPAPLVQFVDLFSIGDGENTLDELAAAYVSNKKSGGSRKEFLIKAAQIKGVYVPSISKGKVERAVIPSLNDAHCPTKGKIANIEAVHNRAVLEIFRGCTRGCRFCQAGMIYRPVRERSVDTVLKCAEDMIDNQGYDELSLSSLSTCDYPDLRELLTKLKPICDERHVTISLPSTRVDSFETEFVQNTRLSSLTFAPEAGTQRLRNVINKNVTEEDIFRSMRYAFSKGYSSVKLYFMLGLPTETMSDVEGIAILAEQIKKLYKECAVSKKPLNLSVSTSTFIPKPFTPFQWERQFSESEIVERQECLKTRLRQLRVKYSYHDIETSRIEAAFARGDERLGDVLYAAFNAGCIFDGWSEKFDNDKWLEAFGQSGITIDEYTKEFDEQSDLAWDMIDCGVTKKFLLAERKRAYSEITTSDCRGNCHNCGIADCYPDAFKLNCLRGKNGNL